MKNTWLELGWMDIDYRLNKERELLIILRLDGEKHINEDDATQMVKHLMDVFDMNPIGICADVIAKDDDE